MKVVAINNCNSVTHIGLPVESCMSTADVQPNVVGNLRATNVSSTSLIIQWDPPSNYQRPGISYRVTIQGQPQPTISTTYFFAEGLNANADYTISVVALNTASESSPARMIDVTTSPSVPNMPPENLRLSFNSNNNNLMISWEDPGSSTFNIQQYRVVWRCNNVDNEMIVTGQRSSSVVIPSALREFSWCTARVQSINSVGRSQFSQLESVVIPPTAPNQPICYFVSDNGGSVSINFGVTDPFSTSGLTYEWQLFESSNPTPIEGSGSFSSSTSNNTVDVMVTRQSSYRFQLRLCNSEGCSDYCSQTNFSTGLVSACAVHVHL